MHDHSTHIFVQIVSYRDPECQWTVKDLFEKAAHPERISVGICWQFDPEKDGDCFSIPYPRPRQVRVIEYHIRDSKGAAWARNEAQKLWQDEEYVLQIQAHMRFEPGWDDALIDMLKRCPSEKPLISTYVPRYTPPDNRLQLPGEMMRIRVHTIAPPGDPQMLNLTGVRIPLGDTERCGLYASPFWIGNFLFAESRLLKDVAHDPHIYFLGEELAYSARLWTHGWDIYQPDKLILYHYWRREDSAKHGFYHRVSESNQRSLLRIKHLLGFEKVSDPAALVDLDKYALGTERDIKDLWAFAGIDWEKRTVAKDSEQGRWNMAARKELAHTKRRKAQGAAQVESPSPRPSPKGGGGSMPRIFVQIASYRDPDCQHTVKDMFDKAAHPERVFAGICWQFVQGEDDICFRVPYPRPDQVRVKEVDAKTSKGVCWARSITQSLWEGEEFTLQIDSHMRFEPGWDDLLLAMWNDCANPKAVLTCYPPGFTPPDDCQRGWVFGMAAKEFDSNGIFTMQGKPPFEVDKAPAKPIPGAFASACMLFGPGDMIKDVPYDPYLYFFGEEITLAVRLWTSGYDIFHPNRLVIFHDWDRGKRPTHFSDHRDWGALNDKAYARVRHLLGTEKSSDAEVLKQIDKYGLGKARSFDRYQTYSGVNFATRTIQEHALKGEYAPSGPTIATQGSAVMAGGDSKVPRIFVNIASYRDPECQWTVKDLFEKAANPDRIFVGICWQFDPEQDAHCFEVSTRPDQVRMLPVNWWEAEGVCWARRETQLLWDGEEYTLMIDSHMRFMQGWDELMIAELAACESDKPVMSCSPARYLPPNQLGKNVNPTIRRVKPFMPDGNIRCQGEMLDRAPEKPLKGAFLVANFIFSRSTIIEEVPYDPYLYFDQEEITYAARLYTHGWDVFSPRRQFLYHYYNDSKEGSVRPLHWRDMRKEHEERIRFLQNRGLKRFNHMTGHRVSTEPEVIKELDAYGFGRVRTLQQFEEYTGLDFKRKIASEKALRCLFIKDLYKYRSKPIWIPELDDKSKASAPQQASAQAQTQSQASARPLLPLEAGDFVPMFELMDSAGKLQTMEFYGGRHAMLFFLPAADESYLRTFFAQWQKKQGEFAQKDAPRSIFICDGAVERLNALRQKIGLEQALWADSNRALARAFGIYQPQVAAILPAGYILNPNLKIVRRHMNLPAETLVDAVVHDCRIDIEAYRRKTRESRIITEVAPALIVPDALTPELCEKCIRAFRTGKTVEGTVGAEEKKAYRPDTKIRTDHFVHGELLAEIDEKLSRSLFPEIKKVFGFEVTHREIYKVGLYTGEKGGFFRQHRDNFDPPLGYRRIAMTLHLNDDYEGGGLRFPEYDDHVYRPAKGSAIAFSCATLHEARPVIKGERFVVVGFFHGEEEEAFRRFYLAGKGKPLGIRDYTPVLRPNPPDLRQSRRFYKEWRDRHASFTGTPVVQPAPPVIAMPAAAESKPNIMINTLGGHKPRKVLESKGAIVIDDFLPEDVYKKVNDHALTTDYEYVNTHGKIARAWHIHDGFPLRSSLNVFYYAKGVQRPEVDYAYPTQTAIDPFVEHLLAAQPHVQHLTGRESQDWAHVSVTSWMYPHGTGLSLHDDGSGVYSGAYVYFLNPEWRLHWGGLLLLMDEEGNKRVHDYRNQTDQMDFYKRKWLHANPSDELLMEHGFAQCIFPKRNRIVFIANDAYHMVTRVNEQAGDNLRMSLAGFFNRKK